MSSFLQLFTDHAASAFARQLALGDLIGERRWGIDLDDGVIRFGQDMTFPVQVLGSHASHDDTWLWGWANVRMGLSPRLLVASEKLRSEGDALHIDELTEPKFVLGDVTDHMLAMLCASLCDATCYYRAPYDGGALFVLLEELPDAVRAPVDGARAITVLTEVVAQVSVDHRRMCESFLRQQGFAFEGTASLLRATRPDATTLSVEFDEVGRMVGLKAGARPGAQPGAQPTSAPSTPVPASRAASHPAPPKKPWWRIW